MAVAQWTLNQVLAQLNSGARWSGDSIAYSFPTSASGLASQGEAQGFRAVDARQQSLLTLALATWDDLMPQAFVPGAPGTTAIEFGYTTTHIGFAHAYFPTVGSVWFNAQEADLLSPTVGGYGFLTAVHEIGHALGLDHMGDYNGAGSFTPSSYQDTQVLSVMSYFGPRYAAPQYSPEVMLADWTTRDGRTLSPQTPMVNDVMAIQAMYGTSGTTRSGDTVYGFNSNIVGATAEIFDFTRNEHPILTIFDSGGFDTLNLSGWSTPSRISLLAGSFSSANDMTQNIAIAYSAVIENAIGGSGDDALVGNDAANVLVGGDGDDDLVGGAGADALTGGPGNDRIDGGDGGDGSDQAFFSAAFASYAITLNDGIVTLVSQADGTDQVVGVERFIFADQSRTLAELSAGGDRSAPLLQSLSPTDNAANVSASASLVLVFSETVKTGSGSIDIFTAGGARVRSIAVGDADLVRTSGNRVTVDPGAALTPGGSYFVTISSGAFTDLANNPYIGLSGPSAWNFSTAAADSVAPRVVSLSPSNDAGNIDAASDLVLTFDEHVRAAAGLIVIRDASGAVWRSIAATDGSQVAISGGTVTIDPADDLVPGSSYSVSVDAGAFTDLAGNAHGGLAAGGAWNFGVSDRADDYPYAVDTPGEVVPDGPSVGGVIERRGDQDLLRIELQAGVTYIIDLQRTEGGLDDPYLGLFTPALDEATVDDDSAGSGNSRARYTATETGTFYIAVLDYDAGIGGYTVRATVVDNVAPTLAGLAPADNAAAVAVNADLVLNFSEPVEAGTGVIRLLGSGGELLREIDVGDTRQVSIVGTTVTVDPDGNLLPGTGYAIAIDAGAFRDAAGNRFAGLSGTTAWNFSTQAASPDDYPLATATPGVVTTNGANLRARIDNPNDGDLFRVSLSAGVTYQFDMAGAAGSAVDPYLVLYGLLPETELIGYNDDDESRATLDSRLFFTPSTAGTFYLGAYDYAEATGAYDIRAAAPTDDYLGATNTAGRVAPGASANGRIGVPSDIDTFALSVTVGGEYFISLDARGAAGLSDPYLVLLAPDGVARGHDDDGGRSGLDSRLYFAADTAGSWFVAASDFDNGIGDYAIGLQALAVQRGSAAADDLQGSGSHDSLHADGGRDTLRGGGGDDRLDGGADLDTAVLAGTLARYLVEHGDNGWSVLDLQGDDGHDALESVERLRFADGRVALDLDGHAGTAARFLGAVFGAESVHNTAYVGIGLDLLDGGMGEVALMQLALDARLGPRASHGAVVDLLYTNVVGVAPPPADRSFFVGLLDSGQHTPASLGLLAAGTELNAIGIDLPSLELLGLPYTTG
ncbi:Ig-like domain-containing protein [Ideonella sp. A 288]|uniref:Ig-like domain-containing protein n=1 Tax=Ideonella sp. A 288 TaxID=1962181 RepID=UPI001303CC7A|nr:Ig-like domain-containing protein [Ideonella sp. A 288]